MTDMGNEGSEYYPYLDGFTVTDLVLEMRDVSDNLKAATEAKNKVQKLYDHIRKHRLPDAMDNEGIRSIAVEGAGSVQLRSDLYASVASGSTEDAFTWLRSTGHGGVIKNTVHSGTLKALLKELLKDGGELPPEDLIKMTPYTQAVLIKEKL